LTSAIEWVVGDKLAGRGTIVQIYILASGSSGNATLVCTDAHRVLFDAGISRRELYGRLASVDIDPASIDAVVVSHEHGDHVCGLVSLLRHQQSQRRRALPVFMNARTASAIAWKTLVPTVESFEPGSRIVLGGLDVLSFTVPHDASDPVGFLVQAEGQRVGLLTDLGYVPDSVRFHLKGCNFLLLESNHDLDMLKVGPYPWSVKQRVMGRSGHLSNDGAAAFVRDAMDGELHTLVLGHLSEQTNHPAVARLTMEGALQQCGMRPRLEVVERTGPVQGFTL
jgi:phosphoribosyl 1,2-cyclic phosphodiesterase